MSVIVELASRSRLNSSSACVSVLYNEMKRSGAAGELVHVRLENVLIRALLHVCVFLSDEVCVISEDLLTLRACTSLPSSTYCT